MSNRSRIVVALMALLFSFGCRGGASELDTPDANTSEPDAAAIDAAISVDSQVADASGCVPACGAQQCGQDPICGLSCGTCQDGYTCERDTCIGASRWGTPIRLSQTELQVAYNPEVRVDVDGNAVLAFSQWYGDTGYHLRKRYDVELGYWSDFSVLGSDSSYLIGHTRMDMDPSGNTMVIWNSGSDSGRMSHRYYDAAADLWLGGQIASTPERRTYRPSLAMDLAGNAIATWDQTSDTELQVVANRYDVVTATWQSPTWLGFGMSSQIAVDPSGDAIAIWRGAGAQTGIHWSRYDADTMTWRASAMLDPQGGSANHPPAVAVDAAGNAIAVWADWVSDDLWSRRYDATTAMWSKRVLLDRDADQPDGPTLDMDADGNAIALWYRYNSVNVWSRRFDASTGIWSELRAIGPDGLNGREPHLGMDADGNAIAVFSTTSGVVGAGLWVNHYDRATDSWATPAQIGADGVYSDDARVSVNADGIAVAVWEQGTEVWGNRFAPSVQPSRLATTSQ